MANPHAGLMDIRNDVLAAIGKNPLRPRWLAEPRGPRDIPFIS
jgi:hypothetical protein